MFGRDGRYAPRTAGVAAAVLLVLVAANILTLTELAAARAGFQHSADLASALARLQGELTDAETSQRGFLLTGQTPYLAPLKKAERQIPRTLDDLSRLAADNPRQQDPVETLRRQATARLAEMRGTVALKTRGRTAEALAVIRSGAGRSLMDSVRGIITHVSREEDRVLQERSARMVEYFRLAIWINVVAGTGLLGLAVLLIGIGRDILRREAQERALRTAAGAQERFFAMVGHDLRNPLSAISIGVQHLEEQGPLPAEAAVLRRIASSGARMERMVGQLLDLVRVQAGALPIDPEAGTDLAGTVAAAADELRVAHPESEIRVNSSGDTMGTWDPDRLAQLASNLLGNAVQHGPSPIDATVAGDAENVTLEVHDGGVIPEDILPTLFDPLRRGRSSDPAERRAERRSTTGLGLGLFICKSIVEAHGGTLHVHSSREDGTTFRVVLPRVPPVQIVPPSS